MRAIRKINNNVVLCLDSAGNEMIAMGRGLGFGKLPRELRLDEIERSFYDVNDRYLEGAQGIEPEVLEFAAKIADIARNELPYELSSNLTFVLADHLSFAIERSRKQLRVKMPLAFDVEQTYPREYRIGAYAAKRAQKEFKVSLPREEAAGIALNLLNARVVAKDDEEHAEMERDTQMLEDITGIVEDDFHIVVDRESFNFSRFATHLQYLFNRLHAGESLESENIQMFAGLREAFPEGVACVERIARHIRDEWGGELSQEEKLYLILHVNRICIKEGQDMGAGGADARCGWPDGSVHF